MWLDIFHSFLIPFIGGFSLTLLKAVADRKLISFDESNDIALDLVLVAVGALGALYIRKGAVEATIDAGIGDAFLASVLLYLRYRRMYLGVSRGGVAPRIGPLSGMSQLLLGAMAVIWTIDAF